MNKVMKSGLAAGGVMLLVSLIAGQILNMFLPGLAQEYQNPGLFRPWSDPLMSLYFLCPFIQGFAMAWVWEKTKTLFHKVEPKKRGVKFGYIFFLATSIPGILMSYASFPVSLMMTVSWTIAGLVQTVTGGWVLGKMNR